MISSAPKLHDLVCLSFSSRPMSQSIQLTILSNRTVCPSTSSRIEGNFIRNPVAMSIHIPLHAMPAGLSHYFSALCSKNKSKFVSLFASSHSTDTLLNILNQDLESSPSQPSPWNAGHVAIDDIAAIIEVIAVNPVEVIDRVLILNTVVILVEVVDSVRLSGCWIIQVE